MKIKYLKTPKKERVISDCAVLVETERSVGIAVKQESEDRIIVIWFNEKGFQEYTHKQFNETVIYQLSKGYTISIEQTEDGLIK